MHLSDFLCAFFDQCNIQGLQAQKKKDSLVSNLNLQNLAILIAEKYGKLFKFFVAKFGISNGKFPRCQTNVAVTL